MRLAIVQAHLRNALDQCAPGPIRVISMCPGDGRHPLYQALTETTDAEGHTGDIRWNFEKFLVGRDGNVIARFSPLTVPEAPELVESIEKAL